MDLITLHLASLSNNGYGVITPAHGASLAETAAVCLENCKHGLGVEMILEGVQPAKFLMHWSPVTEQQRRCYNDTQVATQFGAIAIAILVIKEVTGKVVAEQSVKGGGFDYWIGEPTEVDDDILPFVNRERLEVSGILRGSRSEIDTRVKEKLAQLNRSAGIAPGYAAVVEFSRPLASLKAATK